MRARGRSKDTEVSIMRGRHNESQRGLRNRCEDMSMTHGCNVAANGTYAINKTDLFTSRCVYTACLHKCILYMFRILHICMYVCLHVKCRSANKSECLSVHLYVSRRVSMYASMYVYMSMWEPTCTHTHVDA